MYFKVFKKLALKHHKGIKMKILRNTNFKYVLYFGPIKYTICVWNFFDVIDFLTGQHKAKNEICCKFPKYEKLL